MGDEDRRAEGFDTRNVLEAKAVAPCEHEIPA
jgi:hypothetical protein